jgi:phospholipid/cholesterol/gamma-HCH transport system ATP-binding protein
LTAAVEPLIRIEGIHIALGGRDVLRGLSLDVWPREITVILGPSGVGKSVLLRHVLGLHRPDRGHVVFEGRDISQMGREELYEMRKRMGMLFQDGALFDSLTVFENVAFPLRQHRPMDEDALRAVVMEKLSLVGLADAEGKLPGQLSGGMKKRAGLARALALDPDVLLFDEPSSGLDPVTAAAIDELIVETRDRQQIACLIISHDVESTFRIADRIGMLFDGRIVAYGPAREIRASTDPILTQFFSRSARGPIRAI